MKKKARFIAIAAALLLCVTITVFAVSSYTMTYQPGTTDPSVTNLPDAGTGTGGAAYTVSATIPQRQGYEFIDWTLDYGTTRYCYVIRYILITGQDVADPTIGYVDQLHESITAYPKSGADLYQSYSTAFPLMDSTGGEVEYDGQEFIIVYMLPSIRR